MSEDSTIQKPLEGNDIKPPVSTVTTPGSISQGTTSSGAQKSTSQPMVTFSVFSTLLKERTHTVC